MRSGIRLGVNQTPTIFVNVIRTSDSSEAIPLLSVVGQACNALEMKIVRVQE